MHLHKQAYEAAVAAQNIKRAVRGGLPWEPATGDVRDRVAHLDRASRLVDLHTWAHMQLGKACGRLLRSGHRGQRQPIRQPAHGTKHNVRHQQSHSKSHSIGSHMLADLGNPHHVAVQCDEGVAHFLELRQAARL
jgi:hypothetical protein